MRTRGQILYFGILDEQMYPINMEQMVRKNLTLRAGVARDRAAMLALADTRPAADLLVYRSLITDVLPFDQIQQAFQTACHPLAGQAKIVVHC
jgi:L-iditol 2-dehydrogenase